MSNEIVVSDIHKCTQLIREIESMKTYARTLGDDVLNAIDDLDTQIEKKIEYLVKHTYKIGRMEGAVAKEKKMFKEFHMQRKSHREIYGSES